LYTADSYVDTLAVHEAFVDHTSTDLLLYRVAQKKVPNIYMHYSPEQSK